MFDKLQNQQEEIKKALALASVEVQSGNGLITLKMSGDRRVTGLTIKADHPDLGDTEHLEDHLMLAMNDALDQVAQLEQQIVQEWMSRLLPGGMGGLKGIFGG